MSAFLASGVVIVEIFGGLFQDRLFLFLLLLGFPTRVGDGSCGHDALAATVFLFVSTAGSYHQGLLQVVFAFVVRVLGTILFKELGKSVPKVYHRQQQKQYR